MLFPAKVIKGSHDRHLAKLFGSQVLQLDAARHGVHVDNILKFTVYPIGHGQLPADRIKEASQVKHVPMLLGSQVRQF
jgi:hypothetical protein